MNYIDNYYLFLKTEKKLGNATIESYRLDINNFTKNVSK